MLLFPLKLLTKMRVSRGNWIQQFSRALNFTKIPPLLWDQIMIKGGSQTFFPRRCRANWKPPSSSIWSLGHMAAQVQGMLQTGLVNWLHGGAWFPCYFPNCWIQTGKSQVPPSAFLFDSTRYPNRDMPHTRPGFYHWVMNADHEFVVQTKWNERREKLEKKNFKTNMSGATTN